jgi:chaperonin GroES
MNQVIVATGEAFAIQPLHDRVLVRRLGTKVVKDGLIWIPDIAQENTKTGIVMAIGPKVRGVKPGDEVLLPGVAAKYPDWETTDLMLVEEADIGGIFS